MIAFEHPMVLLLALPWVVFWWWLARLQKRAFGWIEDNVAERFRSTLSLYTRRSLRGRLFALLAMGLLLAVAGARPVTSGEAEVTAAGGRLLVIFDASASMYANDFTGETPPPASSSPDRSRARW